jgi:hypothetical protein
VQDGGTLVKNAKFVDLSFGFSARPHPLDLRGAVVFCGVPGNRNKNSIKERRTNSSPGAIYKPIKTIGGVK